MAGLPLHEVHPEGVREHEKCPMGAVPRGGCRGAAAGRYRPGRRSEGSLGVGGRAKREALWRAGAGAGRGCDRRLRQKWPRMPCLALPQYLCYYIVVARDIDAAASPRHDMRPARFHRETHKSSRCRDAATGGWIARGARAGGAMPERAGRPGSAGAPGPPVVRGSPGRMTSCEGSGREAKECGRPRRSEGRGPRAGAVASKRSRPRNCTASNGGKASACPQRGDGEAAGGSASSHGGPAARRVPTGGVRTDC